MKKWIPVITLIFIFLFGGKAKAQKSNYEVHLIDTGQSDCILIKGTNKNYLIDTGLPRTYDKVSSYLNSQGINKLDEVIITHYHDDHYGGLEKLVQDKIIGKVVLPKHQPKYRDYLFSYLENKNIALEYVTESYKISDGNIALRAVLSKKEDRVIENNNSIVLLGTIDGIKYAFMADVEKGREKALLDDKSIFNYDIVKVPHHALDTSSTREMIEALHPKIALVSCDGDESPSKNVIDRYEGIKAAVFRTDTHGDIIIKANPENKEIEITGSKVIK